MLLRAINGSVGIDWGSQEAVRPRVSPPACRDLENSARGWGGAGRGGQGRCGAFVDRQRWKNEHVDQTQNLRHPD